MTFDTETAMTDLLPNMSPIEAFGTLIFLGLLLALFAGGIIGRLNDDN